MSKQLQGIKSYLRMIQTRRFQDDLSVGDLAYATDQNNPSVRVFIEQCAKAPTRFNANIYKEDEVYLHGLKQLKSKDLALVLYFKYGAQIMDEIRQIVAWKFKGFDDLAGFLDFACGYGRVTRFLIQELRPEQIWVSDIYAKAVQFQQAHFGVNGFISNRLAFSSGERDVRAAPAHDRAARSRRLVPWESGTRGFPVDRIRPR